jgi:glycosyltransferase involved in cell wall biosynthesis
MSKVLFSHLVANTNSRQALLALSERNMLAAFYTTLAWDARSAWNKVLPASVREELSRRTYPGIPMRLIHTTPFAEICRVFSARLGIKVLSEKPTSLFSVNRMFLRMDRLAAKAVAARPPSAVYAYTSGALETFRAARKMGVKTIYELPTAYGQYKNELFREEVELQPDFASTISKSVFDSDWIRRQDDELELADHVIVPSDYVRSTLPGCISGGRVQVIPYGAPAVLAGQSTRRGVGSGKLRVLYVGGLTQAKGLSYLLEAIHKVESAVEFTMIGGRLGSCEPLDAAIQHYHWTPPVPHSAVLEAMENHDVFAFPTLSEGLALVVLEAMSRGMAVITTPNSGALGVITPGRDGFIVPIRSSDALAEKLDLLANDRELLSAISEAALDRARECTWKNYRELLAATVSQVTAVQESSHA